ncbi:hypothetical protein EI94DRAFT_1709552 [Lactarius quietus]|nr:hypothetical protein EI94DRAFT_1709552 [Lactarius quietus]
MDTGSLAVVSTICFQDSPPACTPDLQSSAEYDHHTWIAQALEEAALRLLTFIGIDGGVTCIQITTGLTSLARAVQGTTSCLLVFVGIGGARGVSASACSSQVVNRVSVGRTARKRRSVLALSNSNPPSLQLLQPRLQGDGTCLVHLRTALVNSVLATLRVELLENSINIMFINCVALTGLEAVKSAAQTSFLSEVLCGAIDLAVTQSSTSATKNDMSPVSPAHILAALKAYAPTTKVVPALSSLSNKSATDSETVIKVSQHVSCAAGAPLRKSSYGSFASTSIAYSSISSSFARQALKFIAVSAVPSTGATDSKMVIKVSRHTSCAAGAPLHKLSYGSFASTSIAYSSISSLFARQALKFIAISVVPSTDPY